MTFVKALDKYSSTLFSALVTHKAINEVEIIIRRSSKGKLIPVAQYVLRQVFITHIHTSGKANALSETVEAEYGSIQFVTYQQNANGTTSPGSIGSWNQVTNKPDATNGVL